MTADGTPPDATRRVVRAARRGGHTRRSRRAYGEARLAYEEAWRAYERAHEEAWGRFEEAWRACEEAARKCGCPAVSRDR